MYEVAYNQAVKDFEKAQKQVNALEEEEGNKITIKYKISFEQFMSADQASA